MRKTSPRLVHLSPLVSVWITTVATLKGMTKLRETLAFGWALRRLGALDKRTPHIMQSEMIAVTIRLHPRALWLDHPMAIQSPWRYKVKCVYSGILFSARDQRREGA